MKWHDIICEVAAVEPVEAVKPLTPLAARKRATRQDKIQRQIKTAQSTNALRVNDLRSKMADA